MNNRYEDGDDEDTGMAAGCTVIAIVLLAFVFGILAALAYPGSDIFYQLLLK